MKTPFGLKKEITLIALTLSGLTYSQVGINNTTPKATLDVTAKTTNGTKPEGIIAPRLTGDQIKSANSQYTTAQQGAIVYATSAISSADATGKASNISTAGYYYFDGIIWQKMNGESPSRNSFVRILSNVNDFSYGMSWTQIPFQEISFDSTPTGMVSINAGSTEFTLQNGHTYRIDVNFSNWQSSDTNQSDCTIAIRDQSQPISSDNDIAATILFPPSNPWNTGGTGVLTGLIGKSTKNQILSVKCAKINTGTMKLAPLTAYNMTLKRSLIITIVD